MDLFLNQFSNGVAFMAVQTLLATEGIKSIAALWNHPLKGKKALGVFVVVLLVGGSYVGGAVSTETFVVNAALRALAMVGLYSLLAKIIDALGSHKK
jgi:hypothetical protein